MSEIINNENISYQNLNNLTEDPQSGGHSLKLFCVKSITHSFISQDFQIAYYRLALLPVLG